MQALHRVGRKLSVPLFAALIWLSLTTGGWAAPAEPPPEPATKSYVINYLIVGLAVALGVVMVCRPSYRAKEPDFFVKD